MTDPLDTLDPDLTDLDPATVGLDGQPYLAVDLQPDDTVGRFTLDRSILGGGDVLASGIEGWRNVVCDVHALEYRRGVARLQVLNAAEAGTALVTLTDTGHVFDPMTNRDTVHKGTPVRLRAWSTDTLGDRWDAVLFTGEVDRVDVTYRREDPPLVTLSLLDLVGPLNGYETEGYPEPGTGAGDDFRERVQRILDDVGTGEVSPDSDSTFTASHPPSTLTRAWPEMQAAVEAELGWLLVDRHNRLLLLNRNSQLTGTIRGTLSDTHGEAPIGVHCCMADARVTHGPEEMANVVLAARRRVITSDPEISYRREDEYSRARYGQVTVDRSDLELQTDDQAAAWAEAVIIGSSRPQVRVDEVTPLPSPEDLESALEAWPAVLQTDLADRWLFRYSPAGSPAVSRAVGIVGIAVTVDPDDGWQVTWATVAAPEPGAENPTGWFVLGQSMLSGGDVLAPYRALVG